MKILIIDDNCMNLDIAKDLLEHSGFQTFEAEDALTGIQMMKDIQPDLVLMDLLMPHMDGFQASQLIKADPEIKHIPLIAFTALASPVDADKALRYGCNGIIIKPIDAMTFVSTVESLISTESITRIYPERDNGIVMHQTPSIFVNKSHTILIADDNPMNVDILNEAVTAMGQRTLTCENGKETIRLLTEKKPDLLLLDLMMPIMDGYEVLDAIKANPETSTIPVIIVSAMDRVGDRVKGLLKGGCDYITKPFELTEVQARVSVALRIKDLQDHLRQAEEQAQQAKQEAEEANRQKSKVLSFVSHDFKNPLSSIDLFIGILDNDKSDVLSDKHRELTGYITEGVSQLRRMVMNILDKCRLAEGKVIPSPEWLEIQGFLDELTPIFTSMAFQQNIEIHIDIQPTLTRIKVDPTHLRQILINLVSNAVKYNHRDGKVFLRFYQIDNGQNFVIEVQDTGSGIAPEKIHRLFVEYFRANLSKLNQVEGTGLGLAFIKNLIELNGGSIIVQSEEKLGSTFKVTLPANGGSTHETEINKG